MAQTQTLPFLLFSMCYGLSKCHSWRPPVNAVIGPQLLKNISGRETIVRKARQGTR